MRVIGLAQMKGGVGKSAAAIHLACQAYAAGKRVALLDMDVDQQTAARWGKRREADERFVIEVIEAMELPSRIAELRAAGFDWVFIDLPGRSTSITGAGITAADLTLMPCRPLDVDVEASFTILRVLKRSGKAYAYLMNIAPPQVDAARARAVSKVLEDNGSPVCPTIIIQRLQVPDAIGMGKCAGELDPNGPSNREFNELYNWIENTVEDKDEHQKRSNRRAGQVHHGRGAKRDPQTV